MNWPVRNIPTPKRDEDFLSNIQDSDGFFGNSTHSRIVGAFVASAIAILAITSLLKLATIVEGRPFLSTPAPIFPELSWRELLSLGVLLETGTAILAWWHRRSQGALWVILWLTSIFGIYRSLLLYVRYHGPCNCLGGGGKWLPFSTQGENIASLLALAYLFIGCITLLLLSGRGGALRRVVLGRLLPFFIICTTQSAWGETQGFFISGEQVVFAEYKGVEQEVQRTTFETACSGADWRMTVTFPRVKNVDTYAFVSGVPYLTCATLNRTNVAGGIVASASDMLEAMTEAARVVFVAFLNTKETAHALGKTNSQLAPFVMPRFPAIHAYTCDIQRSAEYPYLPANITWTLDFERISQIPDAALENYFGSARQGRVFTRSYSETQREPATYTAGASTNLNGFNVPLGGKLVHHYFDRDGKSGLRRFEISVHTVLPIGATDLKPSLSPGSRVTHVVDGKAYVYFSPSGTWLSANVAKEVGQLVKSAPRRSPVISTERRSVGTGRILIVCLVLAAPLFIFWVQQQRKHTNNKTIL